MPVKNLQEHKSLRRLAEVENEEEQNKAKPCFFFPHSMFSITVILSGEQQEPKYYSEDTTFGAKRYTAYLQRLDSILATCARNPWKVSRLFEQNVQELLLAQNTSQILLNCGLFPGHYHPKSEKGKDLKHGDANVGK